MLYAYLCHLYFPLTGRHWYLCLLWTGIVRASSLFPILSTILLMLGGMCVGVGRLYSRKNNILLSAGILFVAAGKRRHKSIPQIRTNLEDNTFKATDLKKEGISKQISICYMKFRVRLLTPTWYSDKHIIFSNSNVRGFWEAFLSSHCLSLPTSFCFYTLSRAKQHHWHHRLHL